MRAALQSIMTGHAETKADIKTLLHALPHLGNTLHTIKALLVRPTTFPPIKPTHNSLQDTTITSRSTMTKMERQKILGIPARPHNLGIQARPPITTAAITPNRRRDKVITTRM
jgi:hypothetical protein